MRTILILASLLVLFSLLSVAAVSAEFQIALQLTQRFAGAAPGNNLGLSLAFVGDIDRDGKAELLLGAPGASPGGHVGAGSAYLYSGDTFALLHQFDGQFTGEDFGVSVAGAGDINGDGVPDLLIGADFGSNRTNPGSVFIYSGRDFSLLARLDGAASGDLFGTSLASLGDLNGDGRPDFAVGAIGFDPDISRTDAGAVYVYEGTPPPTLIRRLDGAAAQDSFGISVAGAGDVNRDRVPDLLVGADLADPAGRLNAGSAYLFSGSTFSLLKRFDGQAAGDSFGTSVAGVGDVNGDGTPDLLVGAPAASPGGVAGAGSAYLYSGADDSLLHRFDGGAVAGDFGWSLAGAGDVNGDGSSDLLVGADLANPAAGTNAGSVFLYSGSTYSVLGEVDGETLGDQLGYSVAGDGQSHFAVGAPFFTPSGLTEAGAAYLYKVKPLPTARFSFGPSNPIIGQPVAFNGSASTSPNGPITSYSWTFGDGGTATGVAVSHIYTTTGNYIVSLTVADNTTATNVKSQTITVNPPNQPPTASFTFTPVRPAVASPVTFNASDSRDPDGFIVSYSWNFGDGSPPVFQTNPFVLHTYNVAGGPLTVHLNVTDNAGAISSTSQTITIAVANQPPIARFTHSPASPLAGQTVSFDASTSSDPDGIITSYSWNLGDGSRRNGASMTYTYPTPATYQVSLTVVDDGGASNSTTQQVQILPALTVAASASATGGIAPLSVSFTAQASGGAGPYSYSWDFGDGQPSTGSTTTHTYNTANSYNVRLTVTDSQGNTASDTMVVTVVPEPPERVGPIPADYLIYGLVAGIAALVLVVLTLFRGSRRPKPAT